MASVHALTKALNLLKLLLDDPRGIAGAAAAAGMPLSTAHRMLATLRASGFVTHPGRGQYLPGPELVRLGNLVPFRAILAQVARPVLTALARETGLTAHLGVFDADMVTYLVKAAGRTRILTLENMQLEAYCSGIGKTLLAHLEAEALQTYFRGGPFVQMTSATIIDPDALSSVLNDVRRLGFAIDDGEFEVGLFCVAVPVRCAQGNVCGAISLSSNDSQSALSVEARIARLQAASRTITERLSV